MAYKHAYRWKPRVYSSTTETIIEGMDLDATPPERGRYVRILEAVIYDDTKVAVPSNPYQPGDPATEQYITPVLPAVIRVEVSAFDGLATEQEYEDVWNAARDAQIAAWEAIPGVLSYVKCTIGAARSGLVVGG